MRGLAGMAPSGIDREWMENKLARFCRAPPLFGAAMAKSLCVPAGRLDSRLMNSLGLNGMTARGSHFS